jgi:DNA-binding MarR family transcriptional regulator
MKNNALLVDILRDTIVSMVRRDEPDLTARQLAVLLICCLDDAPHTVRGLAERLKISKPAITRSVDRLEELRLLKRVDDPSDRRSVLITSTPSGVAFVRQVGIMMAEAAERDTSSSAEQQAAAG